MNIQKIASRVAAGPRPGSNADEAIALMREALEIAQHGNGDGPEASWVEVAKLLRSAVARADAAIRDTIDAAEASNEAMEVEIRSGT